VLGAAQQHKANNARLIQTEDVDAWCLVHSTTQEPNARLIMDWSTSTVAAIVEHEQSRTTQGDALTGQGNKSGDELVKEAFGGKLGHGPGGIRPIEAGCTKAPLRAYPIWHTTDSKAYSTLLRS
jgi:hypothetical protein